MSASTALGELLSVDSSSSLPTAAWHSCDVAVGARPARPAATRLGGALGVLDHAAVALLEVQREEVHAQRVPQGGCQPEAAPRHELVDLRTPACAPDRVRAAQEWAREAAMPTVVEAAPAQSVQPRREVMRVLQRVHAR